jgi:hypothetical protein
MSQSKAVAQMNTSDLERMSPRFLSVDDIGRLQDICRLLRYRLDDMTKKYEELVIKCSECRKAKED